MNDDRTSKSEVPVPASPARRREPALDEDVRMLVEAIVDLALASSGPPERRRTLLASAVRLLESDRPWRFELRPAVEALRDAVYRELADLLLSGVGLGLGSAGGAGRGRPGRDLP